MATLNNFYSVSARLKLAIVFGSLVLILGVITACSNDDNSGSDTESATATRSTGSSSVAPTATDVPPVGSDQPTATSVTPAEGVQSTSPTATSADAAAEPDVDNSVVAYFSISDSPGDMVAANGQLAIASQSSGFVSLRSVPSGESAGSIRGGRDAVLDMTFDGENLWTADFAGAQVRKTSMSGENLGKFPAKSPQGITFDGSTIWVSNKDAGTVTNLALDGSEIGVYEAGPFPEGIASDGTNIWVTNTLDESVTRISRTGEILETIDLGIGRDPVDIVADSNYVWVSNGFDSLTRISVSDGSLRDFEVGKLDSTGKIALGNDGVYMTHRQTEDNGAVTKLSMDGEWLSTVTVGGDNPVSVAVVDDIVYVGLDVGTQIAVVHPEAVAAGAPILPDGVVENTVVVEGSEATFTGVLAKPNGAGPYPAVLLVNGSGPQNSDLVFTFRWMRSIAHHLAQEGIASLRVDDRGIGISTGNTLDTTIAGRTADAIDALAFLESQDGIDPSQVGLFGFSEGGGVVANVAADNDVAFVVSAGGPVAPAKDIYALQTRRLLEADGSAESYITQVLADVEYAHNAVLTGENLAELEASIELGSLVIIAPDYIQGDPKELITPWFKDLVRFDPGPLWAKVDEPILALWGEKDWFIPIEQNEPLLREILANSGNTGSQIKIFPAANHFFQPAETGSIGEIATNPREFTPGFLELISGWINEQADGG